jgi:D-alanyl-D-alanine carboxypeptidase
MIDGSRGRFGRNANIVFFSALTLIVGLSVLATPAEAARHHRRRATSVEATLPAGRTDPDKDAALIVDGISGKVLYARNETAQRHPASLTKMMTLYLLFDALKHNEIAMDTTLRFSRHAATQKPTNMHASVGMTMPVETAINALVVRSANDVAVAIAEALGGTEAHFAELMNAKAHALGMRDSFFHNASGLPDPQQVTTASDLAVLARHLAYDFPQYFHYFSSREFVYRGTRYEGHDNLLGRYDGADGMKTGYTGMSGFNLVSSVTRGNTHVIGVVMGGRTAARRDNEMMSLLDDAFDSIQQKPALVAHAQLPWRSVQTASALHVANSDLTALIQRPAVAAVQPGSLADAEDEDAAESRPDYEDVTPMPAPPKPPVAVASYQPKKTTAKDFMAAAPKPSIRPSVADTSAVSLGMHDWTIQIGAFGDLNLARTQLASYAEKSMDVLGQAQRIVVPFQSLDGHWLYRARFGPFLEREARQICARLTERGQTCFAAISTR